MGTVNIALNKATASSSFILPYSPSRAVDGSLAPTSRWLVSVLPAWMSVDLGAPVWVGKWTVKNMSLAGWPSPAYNISDFKLQWSSNNSNWFDADTVTGNTADKVERTVSPVLARYFRVYVTKGIKINPQIASIVELELYQADPTSPYLSNLAISAGTLTPAFSKTTNQYSATVEYDSSTITVTPTAEDPRATIKVNNTVVASGTPSQPIVLSNGSNNITVQVTSLIGDLVQNYTIDVTRNASLNLTSLVPSTGTLVPVFSSSVTQYSIGVGYDVATIAFTPTAQNPNATVKVNGVVVASGQQSQTVPLTAGRVTDIPIEVSYPPDGGSRTYTVSVTRASSPYLSNITGFANLTPPFNKTVYTGYVSNEGSTVKITPIAEDSSARITVNGTAVTSGQFIKITLNTGANTITVIVTSSTGSDSRTYVFTANRS